MRFNCGRSAVERQKAKEQWHLWFAWRPVRIAPGDCRWLERVQREGTFWITTCASGWDYEYRAYYR